MYIVIINSYSGQRRYKKVVRQLEKKLRKPFVSYFTDQYQEDTLWDNIHQKLNDLGNKLDGVIVVGGDGTLHYVVNHLQDYNVPYGLVASGSGNDFGRALKIPRNISKAIERINSNNPEEYDIINANGKKVLSVVGIGVDAETAIRCQTSRLKKLLNRAFLGRLTYLMVFFQTIRHYEPMELEITDEKGTVHQFNNVWLTALGNTSYYGGGIPICPDADPQDSQIEYVIIHTLPLAKVLMRALPAVFLKKHQNLSCVTILKGTKFHIKSKNKEVPVQGDGEEIGTTPACIRILPNAIRIF
ncbi:diacylglycerol/lipid kinase family protein [Evansella tamaricis]|uniref:YegS/Rv2252/BmrU family lipid kinase n=1 Tax=Evansella tamaricis TaxID=2069301 RepID=A0ABS6JEP8_9BACI|nr:YegS/Rv2252/BmrU family lipid kinase [Evansella tamaricis]MBU9711322.1 YegS/Rv2252/BmrU family lipid kinase [Evansella tamaricis]